MRRVLLVDDDELVRKVYQEGLTRTGYQVTAVEDGLKAIHELRVHGFDAVVLDLMMPRLTGVDVLRYIRGDAKGRAVPVLVLSNLYMDELSRQALELGAHKVLWKFRCSPSALAQDLQGLLDTRASGSEATAGSAGADGEAAPVPAWPEFQESAADFQNDARHELLSASARHMRELRGLLILLKADESGVEHKFRLESFYRKVHYLTATAGLAECHDLARMAAALEALLFGLIDKPTLLNKSVYATLDQAMDMFEALFASAHKPPIGDGAPLRVLMVDDDPLADKVVVFALRLAGCEARSTTNPFTALDFLKRNKYDLVLLDIEMPGMTGFELRRQMWDLPGYERVPVIYLTSHQEYAVHADPIREQGDDLISKPVAPLELAVKVVMHLLRRSRLE